MSTKRMRRTGPSGRTPFGYVRHGQIHDVPADADTSGWEAVAAGGKARVTEPAARAPDYADFTVKQLQARLDALGIRIPGGAKKEELVQILDDHYANA